MIDLALFLAVAAVAHALALLLRLPAIPVLMLGGVALGLAPFGPDRDFARIILELGLVFLVFSAGIELSPRRFAHQTSAVLWVAMVQFLLVGAICIFVARGIGYGDTASIYIGFAFSASSTLVVIRHLRAQQQMFQPFGRVVTGVLLVQDVALVLLVAVLAADATSPWSWAVSMGWFFLLGSIAILAHYHILPRLARSLAADDETLLLVSLATLFVFLGATYLMGLPLVAGAFLAGFALAAFPVNGLVRGLIGSVTDFFQALFFVSLGLLLVIPSWNLIGHSLLFALLVFVITPPIVAIVAEWRGQSSRSGIESGLLLAQTSELGIIFALIGTELGHLGPEEFSLIALVAAITMTVTPFVATDRVTWRLLHWHPSRRRKVPPMELRGHVLLLGFGSAGMWAVKPLREAGYEILVVEDDPVVVEMLSKTKVPVLRGDGSDPRILARVNAREAKLIIAAIPRLGDLVQVIQAARGVPVVARALENSEIEAIERAGGLAISNSEAALTEFLKWFDNFCCKKLDG